MNKKIVFRTNANEKIGTGHLMRCITIANELKNFGVSSSFLLSDNIGAAAVKENGYDCILTHSDNLYLEIDGILPIIKAVNPFALVIDSYDVDNEWLKSLNKICRTVYIDDLNAFKYPVDTVLNYNVYAEGLDYSYCKNVIIGEKYAPLRPRFCGLSSAFRSDVSNIFISTGGADFYGIGALILEKLCADIRFKGIGLNIVVGALSPHCPKINKLAKKYSNIKIHQNVTEMAALMQSCDIAVSASGSTLYELCAAGVPTVNYTFADNQLLGASAFAKKGLMLSAGDFRNNENACLENISNKLYKLMCSSALREQMHKNMQSAVDGHGANRICELLLK